MDLSKVYEQILLIARIERSSWLGLFFFWLAAYLCYRVVHLEIQKFSRYQRSVRHGYWRDLMIGQAIVFVVWLMWGAYEDGKFGHADSAVLLAYPRVSSYGGDGG